MVADMARKEEEILSHRKKLALKQLSENQQILQAEKLVKQSENVAASDEYQKYYSMDYIQNTMDANR